MPTKPLIVVRPGWVDDATRKSMQRAGYLVVEAPEGEEVRVIQPVPVSDLVSPDDFTRCLLEAVSRMTEAGQRASDVGWGFIHNLSRVATEKAGGGQS